MVFKNNMFQPQWDIFIFFSSRNEVKLICVQYLHGGSVLLGVPVHTANRPSSMCQYTQLTDPAVHVPVRTFNTPSSTCASTQS